jgi:hypothetical protein
MSELVKKPFASWCAEHGFGIFCLVSPDGERFLVGPAGPACDQTERGMESWADLSEPELRQYLAARGFSAPAADEAIQLSRDWATTLTSSSFFPPPRQAS